MIHKQISEVRVIALNTIFLLYKKYKKMMNLEFAYYATPLYHKVRLGEYWKMRFSHNFKAPQFSKYTNFLYLSYSKAKAYIYKIKKIHHRQIDTLHGVG